MSDKEVQKNVQYRKASMISMALGIATNGGNMCFYLLMMYASFIATEGFGILVAVAGLILTGSRVFDAITDPIVAVVFDRMHVGRFGKIRPFLVVGWGVMAIADLAMFRWLPGNFDGVLGIIVFTALYLLHIVGYTIVCIGSSTVSVVLTNDPVQRPFLNFVGTAYGYFVPMLMSTLLSFAILPRYNNQYNAACLGEACIWYIAGAGVFLILACIGVSGCDNAETLEGMALNQNKGEKIGLKQMWSLMKDNKPLRMYIITGASDKIAQQTAGQSVVATMLNGVLIASYQVTTVLGNIGMFVGIGFALLGGAFIAKSGAKRATSLWSAIAIGLSIVSVAFCLFLGPEGMSSIGVMGVPMIVFLVLQTAMTGVKMILGTAAGVMKADVTDYELERSGNYMPGIVSGVYSFIDKFVSSFGSTIAALCVAAIGYTTVMPQLGDEPTWPLFWMTMFLNFGLPVIGWLFNIFAMRGYELSKDRMVEVQANIAEAKAKAAGKE